MTSCGCPLLHKSDAHSWGGGKGMHVVGPGPSRRLSTTPPWAHAGRNASDGGFEGSDVRLGDLDEGSLGNQIPVHREVGHRGALHRLRRGVKEERTDAKGSSDGSTRTTLLSSEGEKRLS